MSKYCSTAEFRPENVERQLIKSIEDIQAVVHEGFGNVNKATRLPCSRFAPVTRR